HCAPARNSEKYEKEIRKLVHDLPWAEEDKNKPLIKSMSRWKRSPDPYTDTRGALKELRHFKKNDKSGYIDDWIGALQKSQGVDEKNDFDGRDTKKHRNSPQFESAKWLARHEQQDCLQPMIYDHKEFQKALETNNRALHGHYLSDPALP